MPKPAQEPVNFPLIRLVMKRKRKSMTRLAKEIGMQISHLSESLSGKRTLSNERLTQIADALKTHPNYFRTSTGLLLMQKVDLDLLLFSLSEDRGDVKELDEYVSLAQKLGYIDLSPEVPEEQEFQSWDFWKKDSILPFRSENAVSFWEFDGDEILIRGPARCGKSTLILEWVITQMFKYRGLQVLITRAFSVDLDAVRQNLVDIMKYRFEDPLSSIRVIGGKKFTRIEINGGSITLTGIDRPGSQLGAGYDVVLHSQAEQIPKEKIDVINSRCSPASQNWVEDGVAKSRVIYDCNPSRLDSWFEAAIKDGLAHIHFDFADHPAYFTEDGEETELYKQVYSRLSRLEGVWRQRLLEGKAANPEGTIFELHDCHILNKLPTNFKRDHLFYRGFDFGMKDPSVILWFGVHRHTGDVIVFREWRRVGIDTIEMGHAAKQFTDEKVLDTIIDNDENLQSILMRNCGIPSKLAEKGPNSIASGITLIQHRLQKAIDGEHGGLYFFDSPVVRDPKLIADNQPLTVVQEAELYAWSDTNDKPIDKHNHGWDVIRYVLDYLEHRAAPVGFGGAGTRRKRRL